MKTKLDKFRTRWIRWLGQKTRCDSDYWVDLLQSNWKGWVISVMRKCGLDINPSAWENPTRESIKLWYLCAIHSADMKDLGRLDHLYCTDLMERPKRPKRRKK